MPLADYTDFVRILKDFEGMQVVRRLSCKLHFHFYINRHFQIYKLYKQQKIARENWSKTLWSNLNPHLLTEGIDTYMKEFRKIDKWVIVSFNYISSIDSVGSFIPNVHLKVFKKLGCLKKNLFFFMVFCPVIQKSILE